jgi:hypothetical protein
VGSTIEERSHVTMTFDQSDEEGAEEAIEDLEAPAEAQGDVAGGKGKGCGKPSMVCAAPTCAMTDAACMDKSATQDIIVYEQ